MVALIAASALASALTITVTTVGRDAAVKRLANSTAAVAVATGDAQAAFAKADAAAVALGTPGAADRSTELAYLQALADGTNNLERAAQLTRLGEPAEARIRRVLRSVDTYAADVGRAQDAVAAGRVDTEALTRARATMTNLVNENTARVTALHDGAVRSDGAAIEHGRWPTVVATVAPLLALIAVLVVAQVFVARRFRRLLSIPLWLATVVAVGLTVRTVQLVERQSDDVHRAVADSYTASQRLTEARVVAYQIEGQRRGPLDDSAANALAQAVNGAATATSERDASFDDRKAIGDALLAYTRAARSATDVTSAAAPNDATAQTGPQSVGTLFTVLDARLLDVRRSTRAQLASAMNGAREGQRTHAWLAPVVLAAAVALASLGLQRRLAEYR